VLLHEALTGRVPFHAETAEETKVLVLTQEPLPLRKLQAKVPRDLETICLKCLQKDPGQRYPSAAALAEDLQRFGENRPPRWSRPVGRLEHLTRWCQRNPALAVAASLAVAAVLAVSVVSTLWAIQASEYATHLQRTLDQTQYHRALNHLDHGLSLCNSGDVGVGLLWLARALETAPERAEDLKSIIRVQLAGWTRRVIPLKACLDSPAPITAAALSPDGSTVWAAGKDRCLRRWDVASRKLLGPPTQLPSRVHAIAWGPHGKILTVGEDGLAQLWSAEMGTQLGQPLPEKAISAAWDPCGHYFVTGGRDGAVHFWDANGAPSARPVLRQTGKVWIMTVSPDGSTSLTGEGKKARLWDASTGQTVGDPLPHRENVAAAVFSPDGSTILTASSDRTTRLWEARTGKAVGGPFPHKSPVVALAFRPDGRAYVTGGRDRTARVWSFPANSAVGQPLHQEAEVRTVSFSRDGRTLLTAAGDRTLRVWESTLHTHLGLVLRHGAPVRAVGFLPQRGAYTAGYDGAIRFWDQATGAAAGEPLTNPTDPIMSVAFSSDQQLVLARCWSPRVWLWDTRVPQPAGIPLPHPIRWVNSAALSPDGGMVLTGGTDGSVRFWRITGSVCWKATSAHAGPIHGLAFSPKGGLAATGGEDGKVLLWDVATGVPRRPLWHSGPIWSLTFNPVGNTLLTTSGDHTARRWDVQTGTLLEPELRHGGEVRAAVFSPDGGTILTASADATARLWDAATGQPVGRPLVHDDAVVTVAFSPDGRTALTGSLDGTARLWDVTTGKALGPPLAHARTVWAAVFSPDGKFVLTGSEDGTARLWEVLPGVVHAPERIVREIEGLTGLSLDATDSVRLLDAAEWNERPQFGKAESVLFPNGGRDGARAPSVGDPQ
jgi:WD40 repeat protein